ncbi:DUF305 domain-containing protein [Candidatus Woesebacteria bacterium]|nr:DUF305 domain-containing protein [Candidatus Woesebacteria bacterium]
MNTEHRIFMLGGILVGVVITLFITQSSVFNKKVNQSVQEEEMTHIQEQSKAKTEMMMGMDQAVSLLENKSGDELDAAFINMMIPHHEGAVVMAEAVINRGNHSELKMFAQKISDSQQKEIIQMKEWQRLWEYVPAATESGTQVH